MLQPQLKWSDDQAIGNCFPVVSPIYPVITDLTPPHKHTHISRSQRHPHGNRGHHEDNIVGNIGRPTFHVNWSLCVCYCWSDCFSTSPIQHGTRIKKTRWKKSRQVKEHLAYIRPLHHNAFNWPIIPPFQTPFAPTEHVHRPLTRVPFYKSKWVGSRLLYE